MIMNVLCQLKCIVCLLKFSKYLYYAKKLVCLTIYFMLGFLFLNSLIKGKLSLSNIKGWLS